MRYFYLLIHHIELPISFMTYDCVFPLSFGVIILRNELTSWPAGEDFRPTTGACRLRAGASERPAILVGVAEKGIEPARVQLDAISCDQQDTAQRVQARAVRTHQATHLSARPLSAGSAACGETARIQSSCPGRH